MALFKIDGQKLTAIADAIRLYTGSEATMGLDAMAANVETVYSSGRSIGVDEGIVLGRQEGYALGKADGLAEGIEQGKQAEYDRLVDETKIIEKTVSGSIICVDDVSEIPHKCTVTTDKDTNVTVCTKNLLNMSGRVVAEPNGGANTTKRTFTGNQIFVGLTSNNYWYSWYIASYRVDATSVTVTNTVGGYGIGFDVEVIPGCAYTFSYAESYEIRCAFYQADGTYIGDNIVQGGSVTRKAPDNAKWLVVFCIPKNPNTEYTYTNLQVEVGSVATTYEPCRGLGKHSISTGQTIEVDSICPTMNVFADNDAVITFGYHKSYGRQAEYDRFWGSYQNNGKRTDYQNAFSGDGWNAETFKPKYDIKPTNCYMMFRYNKAEVDLVEWFNNLGIEFDDSNNTNVSYMYFESKFTRIGTVTLRNGMSSGDMFAFCRNLITIDKIISYDNVTYTVSTFNSCAKLENITFEGVIGKSISFADSPLLTTASVQSIIDHLKDLTGATAQTLTLHATVGGNLTDAQKAAITAKNWTLVY